MKKVLRKIRVKRLLLLIKPVSLRAAMYCRMLVLGRARGPERVGDEERDEIEHETERSSPRRG